MTTPEDQERPPRWMEYLPLDDLKRAPRNPKGHAQKVISESMDVHGYVEAITLDERTGRIVAGHGRLDDLVARRAAEAPPPEGVTARSTCTVGSSWR